MAHLVGREPRQYGQAQTRWTLASLRAVLSGWQVKTSASLGQVLQRLGIRWRRARAYIHSPDPHYAAKRAAIAAVQARVAACYPQEVLLYLDECTYEQHPTLASAYAPVQQDAPRAHGAHTSNRTRRLLATLDSTSGQVCYYHGDKIRLSALRAFFRTLPLHYPSASTIHVVLDNWPVHFHPTLLACLVPQLTPFEFPRPPSWAYLPSPPPQLPLLPIQLLPLPTYASWCNPIEKLWRKLRQDLLHLHPLASRWHDLQARVSAFLDQFAAPSPLLLRYVGLA